jgi:hypothetical protein
LCAWLLHCQEGNGTTWSTCYGSTAKQGDCMQLRRFIMLGCKFGSCCMNPPSRTLRSPVRGAVSTFPALSKCPSSIAPRLLLSRSGLLDATVTCSSTSDTCAISSSQLSVDQQKTKGVFHPRYCYLSATGGVNFSGRRVAVQTQDVNTVSFTKPMCRHA